MLKLRSLLFSLILFQSLYSQTLTISGYVEDINTSERVIGAYVIDTITKSITQTNNFGYYNLKLNGREAVIQATFIGLKSEMIFLSLAHDTLLNIQMQPVMELSEVIVESSHYSHNVNSSLGFVTIPVRQLTSIPVLGESDLLKSIQSQPGIKGGVEGSSGIFVRGGSGGENLFMLDDVPMYNVSHLYGFFSVFNSSVIKDIKLFKGCFPARYGGRASSVIDVRSRDGNNKDIKGEISLGIISSRLTLEGPLFDDKTTFIFSGRRSYFDLYTDLLKHLNLLDQEFPYYNFYDLNCRLTHEFSQNDKIFLNIYKGKDNITYKTGSEITDSNTELYTEKSNETSGWGNIIGSLRWTHSFNSNLFANTTVAWSGYDYFTRNQYNSVQKDTTMNTTIEKNYYATYKSQISDIILKIDYDYSLLNSHKLFFGAGNTFHTFKPGDNEYSLNDQELNEKTDTSFTNMTLYAGEPFFYIEDEITLVKKLKINTGLRLSSLISEGKMNFNAEPRLSVNYTLIPQLVFKTGYSRMVQYMHLLSNSGLTMPTDIWVPALKGLEPLKSDQINAGFAFNWNKKVLFSVEAYCKWLTNTTDLLDGTSLIIGFSPWYEKTTQGHGKAKGIEISVEKQQGSLTGSINYTLSTADRKYPDINNGQSFPFRYDRLHDFNISLNYQISKKWDVSALWSYGTGYPVTVPVEKYAPAMHLYGGVESPRMIYFYPSRNNYRLPAYHRLDIGVHYKTHNRLGENNISFDVFNAYNRKNPVSVYHWNNYAFKYKYLLPIVPSVTYTLKFD